MWELLKVEDKSEYREMILAFAALTRMFSQKSDTEEEAVSPIVNFKYQETVFQKVFNAKAEDIGNTSFDASLILNQENHCYKFLIGLKTFGVASNLQKIAQFKAKHDDWSELLNQIRENALTCNNIEQINSINQKLYYRLAVEIASLRNLRILSSKENLRGFKIHDHDELYCIYHVLMPSKKGEEPQIFVGETPYNTIDLDSLSVTGCTSMHNPTNFDFADKNHKYRFTAADSQLLMNFENTSIIQEAWKVIYADNAYDIFRNISNQLYKQQEQEITASFDFKIAKDGEVNLYSGFNSFFGVGSKLGVAQRKNFLKKLYEQYVRHDQSLVLIYELFKGYLSDNSNTQVLKQQKVKLREKILLELEHCANAEFKELIDHKLFRPDNEMYIPIPESVEFHQQNPDFFYKGFYLVKENNKWIIPEHFRKQRFTLVFEPSGDEIEAFITQDAGKAIESADEQTILGRWILEKVFQLPKRTPLTLERLKETGLNAYRLYRIKGDTRVHLEFISL